MLLALQSLEDIVLALRDMDPTLKLPDIELKRIAAQEMDRSYQELTGEQLENMLIAAKEAGGLSAPEAQACLYQ